MTDQEIGRRRYARILQAAVSGLLSKGSVLAVNLVSIPIAVRYLGPVRFGIWATISTSLSLLLVLDFGIANTLTNLISEAYAREDERLAGSYASAAFWLILTVAAALGATGCVIWPLLNWNYVFHVSLEGNTVSRSVAVAYAVFLIGMPTGLASKLLGGYQELRVANIFAAAGTVGTLIGVVLVAHFDGGLPMLVGAAAAPLVMANGACLLWIWVRHKPWLLPRPSNATLAVSRRLLQTGGEFFLIQLAGLVVFNSDNLVIAHFAGPAEVTPYNVTWRLVSYATALQTLMLPALWPAYAEAFVRDDLRWIRNTFRRVMLSTMGVAGACCVILFFAGRVLIRHWASPDAVPPQSLLFWMCIWTMISTFMNNVACVLVAASETRIQAWSSVIGALANIALSLCLVRTMGSVGVILGTVASYLVFLLIPQTWKVTQILNRRCSIPAGGLMESS